MGKRKTVYHPDKVRFFMKKKQNRMRFLIIALIPVLTLALVVACNSPVSPDSSPPPPITTNIITYFGNGNTAGEAPIDETKYALKKDTVTVMDRGELYKVGYRFTGWDTKADGSGTAYNVADQFTLGSQPVQLYAQWEEVFPRISAGENFSILVTKEGVAYAAGSNGNGRLGDGSATDRQEFTPIDTTNIQEPVEWISSGTDHSFAILKNGGVAGWGQGDWGKLGVDQDYGTVPVPTLPSFSGIAGITSLGKIHYVSVGRNQTALLNDRGEYWATGIRINGALGNGNTGQNREKVFKHIAKDVLSIAAGQNYILLIKKDGSMWIAGEGNNGKLGTGGSSTVPKLRENTAIDHNNVMVFAGKNNHSMVLKKDGRILASGLNSSGQLGDGTTNNKEYFLPVTNTENTEVTDVAYATLGDNHSMILLHDGTLWAMGRNNESQLGISTTGDQTKAVKVLDHVSHVAAGCNHTLAVKEDGTLWAAGTNSNGQFGQKTPNPYNLWTEIDISRITGAAPAAPATPAVPATP
jgi:alpha-tubulin suppressor-like RCC1 family protein